MNKVLWVLQVFAGIFFVFVGISHFIVPDGLPAMMDWMYDLDDTVHIVSGTAEILGGLGLVLPAVTRIQPRLVPLAAIGLAIVMAGAVVWHVGREEYQQVANNVVFVVILLIIAWGRGKTHPIAPKAA
jgi:uncharacterized membrane protein